MTPDLLICKIAGAILLALFLVLARLLTVTRRPKRDFVVRWNADGIEQGDKGLGNDGQ